MMKKLKIVLFLSAVMALSVGGFVKTQNINSETLQTLEQLTAFNTVNAADEVGVQGCDSCLLTGGWTCVNILCMGAIHNPGYDCTSWMWC